MSAILGALSGIAGGLTEVGSVLASVLSHVISIARQVLEHLINIINRIITWVGEHPEATFLMLANLMIWAS